MTEKYVTKSGIPINIPTLENLMTEATQAALFLIDYFRMNLIYYQLISGKGLEFDKIRRFAVGDDPRRIDWKIFAKTGELNIRAFKEEREFNIVLVVDASDTMLLGTTEKTKSEFAAVIAGALGYAALEAKDIISVVMINEEKMLVSDPTTNFVDVMSVISNPENYGGKKAWHKLVTQLQSNYGEDSIIFIMSDFIDTNVDIFLPELASYYAKVYGIMIRDPVDNELPSGVGRIYLRDASGGGSYLTHLDAVREEYALLAKKQIDEIEHRFHEYEQLFFKLKTTEEFAQGFIKALGEQGVELT